VPLDRNEKTDIFVRDRVTGIARRATLASPSVSGSVESNGDSGLAELSPDGRHLAFVSAATNLVSLDTNGAFDIFVGRLRR
jgi:Tol biopolymer transport system component